MKQKAIAITTALIVVVALVTIVVFGNLDLTGFVTYSANLNSSNTSFSSQLTKLEATTLIEQARVDIETLNASNLSTNKVGDLLMDAEKAMQIADYASILRNEVSASDAQKSEARKALALISWNNANYSNVRPITDEIRSRKEEAFLLNDKIILKTNELLSLDSSIVSNKTLQLFRDAKRSFIEERYNETEVLLSEFQLSLEKDQEKASTLTGITTGTKNFIQKYWLGILIFLILLVWLLRVASKKYKISSLRKKIEKMKFENFALSDIMKKTQEERFKENKISALIYNIRMNKYQQKENEIKETLPALEDELKRLLEK